VPDGGEDPAAPRVNLDKVLKEPQGLVLLVELLVELLGAGCMSECPIDVAILK
jgi:hypothetical protein